MLSEPSKIYIFGDSFADPNFNGPVEHQWVSKLSKKYDVENFAVAGTGPHWSLDLYIKEIERGNVQQNSMCIFVESEPSRMPLQFAKNPSDHKNCRPIQCESMRISYKEQDIDNIYWLFENLITDRWLHCEAYKLFGAVNSLAHKFSKLLYWPLNIWPAHGAVEPANNVTIVKNGLRDISNEAMAKEGIQDSYNLANHLTESSHIQVYNTVQDWIDH